MSRSNNLVKKRKRRDSRSNEQPSNQFDLDILLKDLDIGDSASKFDDSTTSSTPPPAAAGSSSMDELDDLDALLSDLCPEMDSITTQEDHAHQPLLEMLHGAINEYNLPPRVAPTNSLDNGTKTRALQSIEPAPIEMSMLLPEEDEQEIRASTLVHEGGCSMTKTANRIKRGMQERTTRAYDTSPAQTERTVRQWATENRFGDHQSAELFNAAHTICGVHSMSQPQVRQIIDPVAPALGSLVYERQIRSEQHSGTAAATLQESPAPNGSDAQRGMATLEEDIDILLKEIEGYALNVNDDTSTAGDGGDGNSTASSDFLRRLYPQSHQPPPVETTPFAHNGPAYSRNYYTNDETMEELNRALRQMAANVQQNMRMDPLRERHNTFSGVFQPAVNNYLERLLMETPQPTPGQKSWEITNGVMLSHGICLSRAVFDMYLCTPTRGQRACSAGTLCLASRLYLTQSMPPLREFDALNLMEQMGEPECTPDALKRCYDQRRADAASGVRQHAATPIHQLCVLCIMYNIAKAHMIVLNSNTSLPCKSSDDGEDDGTSGGSSASSRSVTSKPELTLTRLYVRIGPGEFSKQDCLFPNGAQYTGLLGPVPVITLLSFQDYTRTNQGEDRPLRALRYLGHEPRQESSVGF